MTLAHALEAAHNSNFDPDIFDDLRLDMIFTAVTGVLLNPSVSHSVTLHAIPIIMYGVSAWPWELMEMARMTGPLVFIAALTRSDNIQLQIGRAHV